jgi:hypothetical protein
MIVRVGVSVALVVPKPIFATATAKRLLPLLFDECFATDGTHYLVTYFRFLVQSVLLLALACHFIALLSVI